LELGHGVTPPGSGCRRRPPRGAAGWRRERSCRG
jgi:hypothetical protein